MRKRVFVKRLLTVVLAATMVLSNSAAAFAEAPSVPAGDTVIVGDAGEEDNTKAAAEEENKTAPGEEEKTGDETNVTTPASSDQTASDSLDTDVPSKDETVNSGDEELVTFTVPEITSTVDASKLPDNDDLLTGFLEKELKEQIDENKTEAAGPILRSSKRSALMGAIPRSQGMNLTGNDLVVYNFLKSEIEKVANGQSDTAIFNLPISLLNGGKISYTSDELGFSTTSSEGIAVFLSKFNFNLDKILDALLADCPYSLYWFDKMQNSSVSTDKYSYYSGTSIIGWHDDTVIPFKFLVSCDYSKGGAVCTTQVNTSLTQAVSTAVTNANSVVNAAKSCTTDYQKLIYYRDWIANNVDYDYEVSPSRYYGNPWQVVWVFDDKPATKVVCEG